MLLKDIINIIESVAPLSSQESYDNSGLQIGSKEASVSSVLLCTDVTDSIVDEAIEKGCQLIISHHPLLFHGLKTIQGSTFQERAVIRCIRESIAIYSSHTSMDSYIHGVSGRMAQLIGIPSYRILQPTHRTSASLSFSSSQPTSPSQSIASSLHTSSSQSTSPLEVGFGVIGDLPDPIPFSELLARVKEVFEVPAIRYIPPKEGEETKVKRIAMCGGAGAELADDALSQGAEVFISADWKHHQFLDCACRIAIMDIGHFESEQHVKDVFALLLSPYDDLEIIMAEADRSPVKAY